MSSGERIDVYLARTGQAASRSLAQRLVMAGKVRMDGEVVRKSSVLVGKGNNVEVLSGPRFVSRGGDKLEGALTQFDLDPDGRVCADVGASTGGFTDCLLQHGARRVYAIDVGHGILDWKLRQDPRVVVMERTNARYLEHLPEPVELVTIDASFISLALLLPRAAGWLDQKGEIIALIKPQFEAGRKKVGKGGVVQNPEIHYEVVNRVIELLPAIGFHAAGLTPSPLLGPKGNREFLVWCHRNPGRSLDPAEIIAAIPGLE